MAVQTRLELPGGIEVAGAYAMVAGVAIDRLRGGVSVRLAIFRDKATRALFARQIAYLGEKEAEFAQAQDEFAAIEAEDREDGDEVAHESRRRAASDARHLADLALSGARNLDAKVQPVVNLDAAVSSAVLAAGTLDGIVAAIYAELKRAGGMLAGGQDV